MLDGCTPWPQEVVRNYIGTGCWEDKTLADALEAGARAFPQRIFVADKGGHLTYGEVDRQAERVAGGLLACGMRPRDIVLLQLPNVRELVVVFFACHKIGVIPVMCLPAHRRSEIAHFARLTGATAYCCAPEFRGFDFLAMAREVQAEAPALRRLIAIGRGSAADVSYLGPWIDREPDAADRKAMPARHRADPLDVAFMLLSGGTTGVPKLIPRTHADYLCNARACADALAWGSDVRYLVCLPAAHNFTLGAPGMVACMTLGASVIMCPSTDADEVFGAIERHRATVLAATPALMIMLLAAPQRARYDLRSLRQICVGGQRMLPELYDRLQAAFPHAAPIHAFGMAEGVTNLSRPGDAPGIRRETQGRPVSPADEFRIVDEEGADVPPGALGELIVRGPYTIRGYYRAEEHNRNAFTADGFYRTGDLVRLHGSGNLVVEGRRKDTINRGGEKISAEEVENLLLSHDSVRLAAVVAMPDPVMGERSCAFIVPKGDAPPTLAQLNEFLMKKEIAKFKLPERLEIVDAFPVTAVGKISKKALREQVASKLRLESGG